MTVVAFFRSTRGRVLGVLAGLALIAYGAMQVSLVGLVLMMVGTVPTVMGLAGICLPERVARNSDAAETRQGRTGEGRA